MAAVPNTATLPHQQLQNTIWGDCPRVQIFCLLCSQMVFSLFAFMGLQKCPLWHGQLVPQTKAESRHWAHSGNCRQLLVSPSVLILWRQGDHCHISNQLLSNSWTIPWNSHLHDSNTAPDWFKSRNYSFLFTNLAITLKELHCAVSTRAAQHFCFILPAQLQACADFYQRCFRPAST